MKKAGLQSVGRRKRAVARVFIRDGEGKISVNGAAYDTYFGRKTLQMIVRQPLEAINKLEKYDILANVSGGGPSGQAGALRHGIARALLAVDEKNRPVLKKSKFLTRDAREVERKKYGRHKARKRPQYSKR